MEMKPKRTRKSLSKQVMESIDHTGELSQEDEQAIRECWETYKKQVSATWQA